jgi:hypothetical protein
MIDALPLFTFSLLLFPCLLRFPFLFETYSTVNCSFLIAHCSFFHIFPKSKTADIKAYIDKTHWNSIKQEGKEIGKKVCIRFPGAKIYSKNENWSGYVI